MASFADLLSKYNKGVIQWDIRDGTLVKCVSYDKDIQEIVVPDGVTAIGDRAFSGCIWAETIRIPDCVTTLGKSPFSGCHRLVNVHIPGHLLEGMTPLGAMWLFTDHILNLPSVEQRFLTRILDGIDDFSPAFRELLLQDLTGPGNAGMWTHRAIQRNEPQWVPFLLAHNDTLPRNVLEKCLREATEAGNTEIAAVLLQEIHLHYPDASTNLNLDEIE